MVGHQAPGEAAHVLAGAGGRRQIHIGRIVGVLEECVLAAVAALRHVVGDAGNDDRCETGHGSAWWRVTGVGVSRKYKFIYRKSKL